MSESVHYKWQTVAVAIGGAPSMLPSTLTVAMALAVLVQDTAC